MLFALERAQKIADELKKYIFSDSVRLKKYKMAEGNFLNPQQLEEKNPEWKDFEAGQLWGQQEPKGHYWFKTSFELDQKFKDKKVAILAFTDKEGWDYEINPQFMLYINGELKQGLDLNHREVILTNKGVPGEKYNIDLHAYSGRTATNIELFVDIATYNENIKDCYYNIQVPLWVAEKLDKEDKRRIDILKIVNQTINKIDLRKPFSDMFFDSINEANAFIQKTFYEDYCGHDEVIATCVGHTHIDIAWHWTIEQTREKVTRSFSTVLDLMNEYPEYKFMSSQPILYKFLKEDHPEVYAKVKDRVADGSWEPEGAMWVEADCNVTSGESLVRQILFGKGFFKQEFGVDNEILWLPDVFGYSAALPQILKKSDVNYFMTTKIAWNQFNKLPYDTFMWQGIDDTEILTHLITTKSPYQPKDTHFTTYNGIIHPGSIMGGWDRYQQKEINNDIMIAFGYGDGGGGATAEMLETARRMKKGIPGCPKVKMGHSLDYFKKLEDTVNDNKYLPRWVGELYLEYHRGTYTSMAKNKRYNRKSELLYQDIEFLSVLDGTEYNQEKINENWETILTNQFHDILPGSSIKDVYERTTREYKQIIADGEGLLNNAINNIANNINLNEKSVVVYNTLSYDRDDIAKFDCPENINNPIVVDDEGIEYPCQFSADTNQVVFYAKNVPSKGYKSFIIKEGKPQASVMNVSNDHVENKFFCIDINDKGELTSIFDKQNRRQVIKDGMVANQLQAFEDKPMNYDNWDIDIYYPEKMWIVDDVTNIEVVENGPVRSAIKFYKKFSDSTIIQTMYVYNDIPRIDFDTYIDWKESQVMMKASFPVDIHADKATYEIQFGNVERPTHWNTSWDYARFEVCGQKWADLSEEGYGVSLLNDCKYGHDIKDGTMRLTLLKSGIHPNKDADKEEHRFAYSLYPHANNWKNANTVEQAYAFNVPLYTKVENAHEGSLNNKFSLINIKDSNVIVETVKKAEKTDDIIIRVYECKNKRTKTTLTFGKELAKVIECNLIERDLESMQYDSNSFEFEIKPYEIKSFKVKFK